MSPTTARISQSTRSKKPAINAPLGVTHSFRVCAAAGRCRLYLGSERHFDAASAGWVTSAAQQTSAHAASLSETAGFDALSLRSRSRYGTGGGQGDRRGAKADLDAPTRACASATGVSTQHTPCGTHLHELVSGSARGGADGYRVTPGRSRVSAASCSSTRSVGPRMKTSHIMSGCC